MRLATSSSWRETSGTPSSGTIPCIFNAGGHAGRSVSRLARQNDLMSALRDGGQRYSELHQINTLPAFNGLPLAESPIAGFCQGTGKDHFAAPEDPAWLLIT